MKLKNIVLVLLLCPLLLVGCRNYRASTAISNPDIFPPTFKYSEIQDKTLEVVEKENISTAPFFVQNYTNNFHSTSGNVDKDLVLYKMRQNSAQYVHMVEDVLKSRGYQKVSPEEANCVISICYGEGNKDGRIGQRGVISRYKIGFLEVSCDLPDENVRAWQVMAQVGKKRTLEESAFGKLVKLTEDGIPKSKDFEEPLKKGFFDRLFS